LVGPVSSTRLAWFMSVSCVPFRWPVRWVALTKSFYPTLSAHGNFILGVRPAARVATASRVAGFIWIESGYTWLLWAGGIPLLAAFIYFLWKNLRFTMPLAQPAEDATGVAALAVATGLWVVGVLMTLDPHLTYRGSADL